MLDTVLRVESAGWKGEAKTALAFDARRGSFYRRYAAAASRLGILRICLLRIAGEAAAMQLAVETCGGFWLLKIGYDQKFNRCSPGNLLMRDTIAAAAQHGLASYEFLGETATWTEAWTPQVREQVAVRIYPGRPVGLAAMASDAASALWYRWNHR